MRRVTRNGVIAVAAASGAMAVTGSAFADSAADGAAIGSPGVISGNTIQLPVHVPVNVCGNTASVVGVLNPAVGNMCANQGGGGKKQGPGSGSGSGGATADGLAKDSPGVASGNGVQLPVDLPVNVSGNTGNAVGIGNPVFGNESVNTTGDRPAHPAEPQPEPPTTPRTPPTHHTPPKAHPAQPAAPAPSQASASSVSSLASTGADGALPVAVGSAAFLLGGAALYRRYRPQTTR
ncbi:chaplin [Streptomyces sp. NPDC002888]|uniref:chaplin n=1 Tax=Streptomyces sp. NPDC002888 TaxID=3364668 RepID=UPI0036ADA7BF